MCIRDSGRFEAEEDYLLVSNILTRRIRDKWVKATERYKSCLLYTSDAADERSSVDLGGRRIIKKKKHTNGCCLFILSIDNECTK